MLVALATFEHLPIRVGGLSEAATSLGESLAYLGEDVMVLMPSHGLQKEESGLTLKPVAEFEIRMGERFFPTTVYEAERKNVKLFLLSNEILDRKEVYGEFHILFEKIFHFAKAVPAFLNHYIDETGNKPDVFHSNDWHAVLAAEYVKKYFRIPYVYTIHRICNPQIPVKLLLENGFDGILNPAFAQDDLYRLEPYGGAGCGVINTVSYTYLEEEWERFFKTYEGKATYVWNGIDASFWDPKKLENPKLSREERRKKLLRENGFDDGTLFFYVGRLDPEQKGVDYFIDAIERVMGNGSGGKDDLRFIILGAGDKNLEEHIHSLERQYPKNVKGIIGYLQRETTREYYASADFCVIPSNFEPFGLVQLEAMCLGSIPIGTKVGGINDTVIDAGSAPENATGRLVPPRDSSALAHAIHETAEWARRKPEFLDKLRKNGRRHVTQDFTWERAAGRYVQLYKDAASVKISFARYSKPF